MTEISHPSPPAAPPAEPPDKAKENASAQEPGMLEVVHSLGSVNVHTGSKHRTPGLKLFDVFLYPFLTNFVVFGLSVAATYLTSKGGKLDASGKPMYGKIGQWFARRGTWMDNKFKAMGMTQGQAEMARMVFFSFADGTAVAPMVKLLEDRREQIACWADTKLGTSPEDEAKAYKAEPKQSWFSVIMGRLATVSIVVPTAVILDKAGLNKVLFSDPGWKFGQYIASKPHLAKYFGKHDIAELGKVGVFEAFYTSTCTLGLYFASRFLATITGKKRAPDVPEEKNADTMLASAPVLSNAAPAALPAEPEAKKYAAKRSRTSAPPAPCGLVKVLAHPPSAQFTDLAEHPSAGMERT